MFSWLVNRYSRMWIRVVDGDVLPPQMLTYMTQWAQPGSTSGASPRGKAAAMLAMYQLAVHHWPADQINLLLVKSIPYARLHGLDQWIENQIEIAAFGSFVVEAGITLNATDPCFLGVDFEASKARAHAWALGYRDASYRQELKIKSKSPAAWAKVTDGVNDKYTPDFSSSQPTDDLKLGESAMPATCRKAPPTIYPVQSVLRARRLSSADLALLGWGMG